MARSCGTRGQTKGRLPTLPDWRIATHWPPDALPREVRAWLLDDTSLTQRLKTLCPTQFNVVLRAVEHRRPLRDERQLLGIADPARALVRTVQLRCAATPWVFARTVIPLTTLHGRTRRLRYLGARSLGEVLFRDPSLRRGPLQIACLRAPHPVFDAAQCDVTKTLWGRRSLFWLQDQPLLVTEIFLPALLSHRVR